MIASIRAFSIAKTLPCSPFYQRFLEALHSHPPKPSPYPSSPVWAEAKFARQRFLHHMYVYARSAPPPVEFLLLPVSVSRESHRESHPPIHLRVECRADPPQQQVHQ